MLGRHDGGVTAVRVAQDGRSIYSASADQTIRIWEPGGFRELVRFGSVDHYGTGHPAPLYAQALALQDSKLACALKHGTVRLLDAVSGAILKEFENPKRGSSHPYDFCTVDVHGDLIAGSNRGWIVVWRASTGEVLVQERGYSGINAVAFLRQGSVLMAQDWMPAIALWDPKTWKSRGLDSTVADEGWNLVTSRPAPQGSRADFVVSALDDEGGHLLAIHLDEPDPLWQGHRDDRIHDACFLGDGRHLVSGAGDGFLELWDTEGQAEPLQSIDMEFAEPLRGQFEEPDLLASGVIHTTPELDPDSSLPWAVQTVAVGDGFVVAGLVAGHLVRMEILGD